MKLLRPLSLLNLVAVAALAWGAYGIQATHNAEITYLQGRLFHALEIGDMPVAGNRATQALGKELDRKITERKTQRDQAKLTRHITRINPRVTHEEAVRIVRAAYHCGQQYSLDPKLLLAMAQTESHFDTGAVGQVGERGLMQLQRRTAESVGMHWSQAFDPDDNLCAGAAYLWEMHRRHRTRWAALKHYNGGAVYPGRVMDNYRAMP